LKLFLFENKEKQNNNKNIISYDYGREIVYLFMRHYYDFVQHNFA